MTKKFYFILLTGIICLTTAALGVSPERVDALNGNFAAGLDKLLIDTEHVYVYPADNVTWFELPDTGLIFTGKIAMTSGAGKIMVGKTPGVCIEKKIISDIDIDMADLKEDLAELAEELTKLSEELGDEISEEDLKNLSELSHLSKLSALGHMKHLNVEVSDDSGEVKIISSGDIDEEKIIKIKTSCADLCKSDQERLEKMDEHLDAFKKELASTVMDYAPILKGMKTKDQVVVVFTVKDKEFLDKYGTSNLTMQIPYKKLTQIQDLNADDPDVMKAFEFNL